VLPNPHKEREYGSFEMGLEQVINGTHDHVTNIVWFENKMVHG